MIFETENIEFKSCITDDIYKEIIAFANTDGGIVYIGIDDNGNVVGIDNIDENYNRITNGIRDAIMPDVTMFVKYLLQDNNVIRITVGEGSYKPYYIKSKGLKPSGVYIRQGASSVPASHEQIRQMIKDSDGDDFEEKRSMEQDLTFDYAMKAFGKYGVEFSPEKYRVLNIINDNNLYTNVGLLLSDQCPHTIKVAVFANEANTEFRDSKEFSGSVFAQLDEAFSYLKLCNRTAATFAGLERVESSDYPEEAVREALLNSIVHRDYSYSGSIIINVNDRETEFISIGGLVPGLSTEDIKAGISQPRNKKLAEVFHRLRLIESYGTGIRKIFNLYGKSYLQPRIEVTPNTFKIVLPNMNIRQKPLVVSEGKMRMPEINKQQQEILEFIELNGQITESEVRDIFDVGKTRAYMIMREMCEMGLVVVKGRGQSKRYVKGGR